MCSLRQDQSLPDTLNLNPLCKGSTLEHFCQILLLLDKHFQNKRIFKCFELFHLFWYRSVFIFCDKINMAWTILVEETFCQIILKPYMQFQRFFFFKDLSFKPLSDATKVNMYMYSRALDKGHFSCAKILNPFPHTTILQQMTLNVTILSKHRKSP